jgi:hypothetical protein
MADDHFDTSALVDTEYTGGLNRTLVPIPEGEFLARVKPDSVKVNRFTSKAGNLVNICNLVFSVEDEDVKAQTRLPDPSITASIFLDLDPGTGRLLTKEDNPNANVGLGKLKHALGIREGKAWSLRQFEGMACYIRVVHEPNPDDIENPRSKVTGYYKESKADKEASASRKR